MGLRDAPTYADEALRCLTGAKTNWLTHKISRKLSSSPQGSQKNGRFNERFFARAFSRPRNNRRAPGFEFVILTRKMPPGAT
jgi:hypothetical protein